MITWSVVAGVLGICGTGAWIIRLSSRSPHPSPERYWLLGMAALFLAWLIAFLGVLGSSMGPMPKGAFIGSSSVPLVGVIVTDIVVRHLRQSGRAHRPVIYWLLGVAAILPGWGIALLALSVNVVRH